MSILPEAWWKEQVRGAPVTVWLALAFDDDCMIEKCIISSNIQARRITKNHGKPSTFPDSADHTPQGPSPAELVDLVCTSGRPFNLMEVRVVSLPEEADGQQEEKPVDGAFSAEQYVDVVPGSGSVGEVWCRGPTVFPGEMVAGFIIWFSEQ